MRSNFSTTLQSDSAISCFVVLPKKTPNNMNSEFTLDNEAVVDYGPQKHVREWEGADMELQHCMHHNLSRVPIPVSWIVGHQATWSWHTAQQKANINRKREVDSLAKMVAGLPLLHIPPTEVSEIHVGGG